MTTPDISLTTRTHPFGSPAIPLVNGHLSAHSQIRAEIIVNADAIAAHDGRITVLESFATDIDLAPWPRGQIATDLGPPTTLIIPVNVATPLVTLNVAVSLGRRYRIYGAVGSGFQVTGPSATQFTINDDQGGQAFIAYSNNVVVNQAIVGNGSLVYVPITTKTAVLQARGLSTQGTYSVSANQVQLSIDDIGPV